MIGGYSPTTDVCIGPAATAPDSRSRWDRPASVLVRAEVLNHRSVLFERPGTSRAIALAGEHEADGDALGMRAQAAGFAEGFTQKRKLWIGGAQREAGALTPSTSAPGWAV